MIYKVKYHKKKIKKKGYSSFVLGGDIGGTNTKLVVAGLKKKKPELLFSFHFESKRLDSLVPAIEEVLRYAKEEHGIKKVEKGCFGGAGKIEGNNCDLTNLEWGIDGKEIKKKTKLRKVLVVNDFQAVGYSLDYLEDLEVVRDGRKEKEGVKVVIGAGTGLGKSIVCSGEVLASEGGHGDLSVQNKKEMELVNFIKRRKKIKQVSWEDVLSGDGLVNIYSFLKGKKSKYTKEIDKADNKAELISRYRKKDKTCKKSFEWLAKFYARCGKNFVLDTLAKGGLYIAGGIAARNKEIFKSKDFMDEFEKVHKQEDILKEAPIYVITNEDAGLIGACVAVEEKSNE